jgi:hypothetical protein
MRFRKGSGVTSERQTCGVVLCLSPDPDRRVLPLQGGGSATALIWKRFRWPRSRGGIAVPQLLPLVGSGMKFTDGAGLKSGTKGDVSDQPERNAA